MRHINYVADIYFIRLDYLFDTWIKEINCQFKLSRKKTYNFEQEIYANFISYLSVYFVAKSIEPIAHPWINTSRNSNSNMFNKKLKIATRTCLTKNQKKYFPLPGKIFVASTSLGKRLRNSRMVYNNPLSLYQLFNTINKTIYLAM